ADHMLATFGVTDRVQMSKMVPLLDRDFRAHPDDLLCGWQLINLLYPLRRSPEALSVVRQMHERRSDLQFGSDLQQLYRYQGRTAEIPRLEAAWLERAPDNEQAMVAAVAVALEDGRPADAERQAQLILAL